MAAFKKLLLVFVGFLFIILLFTTAFDIGFIRFSSSPEKIKTTIAKAGIYDSVVPALLDHAGSISTSRAGEIPLKDPGVRLAAQKAVPASYIQKSSESFIDSIYRWLDGGTREPDFYLDLGAPKTALATNISAYVKTRLDSLPACPPGVLPNPATLDVFGMTCKPVLLNSAEVANSIKNEIANNYQLVDKPFLTANQISAGDGSGKSIFQVQLAQAPKHYQKAKQTPLILSALTILAGIGVVLLSANWQKGLRHIGIILVVVGLVMLLFAWSVNREVNKQLVPKIKADNLLIQKDLRNLASDLTDQVHNNYLVFGAIYTVVGAGVIAGAEIMLRRGQIKPDAAGIATSGLTDSPKPKAKAKLKTGKKL